MLSEFYHTFDYFSKKLFMLEVFSKSTVEQALTVMLKNWPWYRFVGASPRMITIFVMVWNQIDLHLINIHILGSYWLQLHFGVLFNTELMHLLFSFSMLRDFSYGPWLLVDARKVNVLWHQCKQWEEAGSIVFGFTQNTCRSFLCPGPFWIYMLRSPYGQIRSDQRNGGWIHRQVVSIWLVPL